MIVGDTALAHVTRERETQKMLAATWCVVGYLSHGYGRVCGGAVLWLS